MEIFINFLNIMAWVTTAGLAVFWAFILFCILSNFSGAMVAIAEQAAALLRVVVLTVVSIAWLLASYGVL